MAAWMAALRLSMSQGASPCASRAVKLSFLLAARPMDAGARRGARVAQLLGGCRRRPDWRRRRCCTTPPQPKPDEQAATWQGVHLCLALLALQLPSDCHSRR